MACQTRQAYGILFQDIPNCRLSRFRFQGVQGLCIDDGELLEIITVWSTYQQCGLFKDFIEHCKAHYRKICVYGITEPILEQALARYGFDLVTIPCLEGIPAPSMQWSKPALV